MTETTLSTPTDTSTPVSPLKNPGRHWRRWLALTLIVSLLGLVGWKLWQTNLGPVASGAAPDFALTTFDGETLRLSDLRGQVVVINIWASWCIPCRDEAPVLERLWREYRDRGVVFLGVAYADTDTEARAFIAEFGLTYPNGPDVGTRIYAQYRARGVPETYFVDAAGQLRSVYLGPIPEAELRRRIEAILPR